MNDRAYLGMSHSPLLGLNPLPDDVEKKLNLAIEQVRAKVEAFDPELIVLVGPDHYNGFFNELMPPFCLGTESYAVGDYLTPSGHLNVPEEKALSLADHLMDSGFDLAISRRMQVDHGFSQALQFLWGGLETPPVIPIFMNAVAQPAIPRLNRCIQLGQAIGTWLDALPERTLLIGSGGLSHEPPVPTFSSADPEVRERITIKKSPTPEQRVEKTKKVMAAGMALASGSSAMKPLSPIWDTRWMDALESSDYANFERMTERSIEKEAGLSAHESKTWLIAHAALPSSPLYTGVRFYRAIPELIAGYGILYMQNTPLE